MDKILLKKLTNIKNISSIKTCRPSADPPSEQLYIFIYPFLIVILFLTLYIYIHINII